MMNLRFKASSAAIAALSLTGMIALSACEERPYPEAKHYAEAPKAAAPVELAGAPAMPAPPPPPVAYEPPAPAYNYAPPPVRYGADEIVGMAPIPNPGDEGYGYGQGRHRVHGHYNTSPQPAPAYAEARPPVYHGPIYHGPVVAPVHPPIHHGPVLPTPAPKTYAAAKPAPVYVKPAPAPVKPAPAPKPNTYAQKGAAAGAAAGAVAGVVAHNTKSDAHAVASTAKATYDAKKAPAGAPTTPAKVGQDVKAAAAATVAAAKVAGHDAANTAKAATTDAKAAYAANKPGAAPAAPAKPADANTGDRSTRLASLQSALTDAISKGAVLAAPERFTANQPADVTLTVPAAFADTLRNEAQKDGLSDAAASVNLTGILSGDGFSVTPDETQSQPLTVGQPTVFRWTVTAQPGAKGPLHADVGADLLGGGSDTLALGSVQKQAGFGIKPSAKLFGAAILFVVLALLVAWLARGRGPARSASARRASRSARGGRPLDMDTGASSGGGAAHH